MSEISSKKDEKAPAIPGIESPKPSDELDAGELDKVSGGMKPNIGIVRKSPQVLSTDPCDGGE